MNGLMLKCEGPKCNKGIVAEERMKAELPNSYSAEISRFQVARRHVTEQLAESSHSMVSGTTAKCQDCGFERRYGA